MSAQGEARATIAQRPQRPLSPVLLAARADSAAYDRPACLRSEACAITPQTEANPKKIAKQITRQSIAPPAIFCLLQLVEIQGKRCPHPQSCRGKHTRAPPDSEALPRAAGRQQVKQPQRWGWRAYSRSGQRMNAYIPPERPGRGFSRSRSNVRVPRQRTRNRKPTLSQAPRCARSVPRRCCILRLQATTAAHRPAQPVRHRSASVTPGRSYSSGSRAARDYSLAGGSSQSAIKGCVPTGTIPGKSRGRSPAMIRRSSGSSSSRSF